jgi:hypothetical protein
MLKKSALPQLPAMGIFEMGGEAQLGGTGRAFRNLV